MGHQAGLNAVYARYDQAQEALTEEYLRVVPSLSIFSGSKNVAQLQERVDRQSADIQELITNLSVENARIKSQMADLLGKFDGLRERIEELEIIGAVPEEQEALRSIPEDAKPMTEEEKAKYWKSNK